MNIDFSDVQIQVAIISGLFTVLSTLIAAIAGAIVGKSIVNREKYREDFKTAIDDIQFLLEVERIHCERNTREQGSSRKNKVRDEVRRSGKTFSGDFTPGRVRADEPYKY